MSPFPGPTPSAPQQNTYDQFADQYAQYVKGKEEEAFSFYHDLMVPYLFQYIGDVTDLNVLDAGCGEGIISRLLSDRSAKVTAIDVSPRLVALARARDIQNRIVYQVHDLSQPLPQYNDTFDLVVSNLVLNDVPDYQGFAATLGAIIKPGGHLVLSLNNPYSAIVRGKVHNYFDSGAATLYVGLAKWGVEVYFYHRTFEEYITAFSDAGLLLKNLSDVQVTDKMRPEGSLPAPQHSSFPFLMVLEFVKPAPGAIDQG